MMMLDGLTPGICVDGACSNEDISNASTEIICIPPPAKRNGRKALKRQKEIQHRSHSADRILDDGSDYNIELTPILAQVNGIDVDSLSPEKVYLNGPLGIGTGNRNANFSKYRVVRGTSCDTSEVSRLSSAASRQDNSFSRQESLSSRYDASFSRQDSTSYRGDMSISRQDSTSYRGDTDGRQSRGESRQSGLLSCRLDSISRQNSSVIDESPSVAVKNQSWRRASVKDWSNRKSSSYFMSFSGSMWDNRLERCQAWDTRLERMPGSALRQSYSHMRHSTDILDTLENSKPTKSRLDLVEENLYLGNMDAATDVLTLQSHSISHIITVDSVPLPRKICSLLPRIKSLYIQITDIPSEDLLTHIPKALEFIETGVSNGVVLVHCFYGKSRSATIVLAYLMQKHRISFEEALEKLRLCRSSVNPNPGFRAQLKLWEAMKFTIDPMFLRYKMYRIQVVGERIRKSKIVPLDVLKPILETFQNRHSSTVTYKCKFCRADLTTSTNQLPHIIGESPQWYSPISKTNRTRLCSKSVYTVPMDWMGNTIRNSLSGSLLCPKCKHRIGEFSWVMGVECVCGAAVAPAFKLHNTALIFTTEDKYLQGNSRQPVLV